MELSLGACMLIASLTSGCGAVQFPEEDGVIVLTNETIDSALQQFPHLFIEFYAPWCGHCQKLAPEYAQAASSLAEEMSTVRLAKIDASLYRDVGEKYSISHYPTMKLFIDKLESFVFESKRTASAIVVWLKKRLAKYPVNFVHSVQAARTSINSNQLVAFGFFKKDLSEELDAFMSIARNNDHFEFLVTSSNEVFSEFGVTHDSVVIFKQFDERMVDFQEPLTVESLATFLKLHRHPLVTEYNNQTRMTVYHDNESKRILWLFVDRNSPDISAHVDTLTDVALAFRAQLLAVLSSDADTMSMMGVRPADCPAVLLFDHQNMTKYRPLVGHQLTSSKIGLFVRSALDGKLQPYYKSEPVPDDWDARPVKILVGANFKQVALDKSKHVFVKFYMPSKRFDEEFAPILEELAAQTTHRGDVIVAKLDVRANDLPDTAGRAFLSCMLYPKGGGEAVSCADAQNVDDYVNLIEKDGQVKETKEDGSNVKSAKSEL